MPESSQPTSQGVKRKSGESSTANKMPKVDIALELAQVTLNPPSNVLKTPKPDNDIADPLLATPDPLAFTPTVSSNEMEPSTPSHGIPSPVQAVIDPTLASSDAVEPGAPSHETPGPVQAVIDPQPASSRARDPVALSHRTPGQAQAIIDTPSPYAILPTPEAVLGRESSLTRSINSSIGTSTPQSPAINHDSSFGSTPRPGFRRVTLSSDYITPRPGTSRSLSLKQSTQKTGTKPKSLKRQSKTPFDKSTPRSSQVSGRKQMLITTLLPGIAPLDKDLGPSEPNADV